jgi:hypothetical protein
MGGWIGAGSVQKSSGSKPVRADSLPAPPTHPQHVAELLVVSWSPWTTH